MYERGGLVDRREDGAGDGIGRIASLQYAAHGATVILLGRTVEKLETEKIEIEVQTLLGTVIKTLDEQERREIIEFKTEVRERHDLLRESIGE